jgi:hypothetical protein
MTTLKPQQRVEVSIDKVPLKMKLFTNPLIAICALLLTACVSSNSGLALSKPGAKLDRAAFDAYNFRTTFSNASYVVCHYGKQRIANYDKKIPPRNEVWGGNVTYGSWDVYPQLKCTWLAADGSPQQEVVKTGSGLFAKYVEWEHIEGETLFTNEPLQLGIVTFTIRVDDKNFYITRDFNVQLYGERISANEHRIKSVEVKQVIYQRPLNGH